MKKKSRADFFKKNIFTSVVFVKTMVAIALLFFYALVFSVFLPKGINDVFVTKLSKWLLMLIAALSFVYVIYFYLAKKRNFKYKKSVEGFHAGDLFLLLLPMDILCLFRHL